MTVWFEGSQAPLELPEWGGDPARKYRAVLRFRGVVEPKTYANGTPDVAGSNGQFYEGGAGGGDPIYKTYGLTVSDPPQDYFLNDWSEAPAREFTSMRAGERWWRPGASCTLGAMPSRSHVPHRLLLACASLGVFASTRGERAAPADACAAQHVEGQRLMRQGRLRAARAQFIACAADACPAPIRKECSSFETEVETETPTAVLALLDEHARDVRGAVVRIDGSSSPTPLNGRAVALDPGTHSFAFAAPSGARRVLSVVIREGERDRKVVAFAPPRTGWSRADSGGLHVPTLTYVFGGVGLAAATSFAYFAISGHAKQTDLEEYCAPYCSRSDVDAMRTRYLFADVSLGLSIVSLGLGAYFLFTEPHGERPDGAATEPVLRWSFVAGAGVTEAVVAGDLP